jgi:hypothetical protein
MRELAHELFATAMKHGGELGLLAIAKKRGNLVKIRAGTGAGQD